MTKKVVQLYPQPGGEIPLQGLYLSRNRLVQENTPLPLVYANFSSSIDGRIALQAGENNHYRLPSRLKSEEDFMLLLELYTHADCIITHGGYMRALAEGRLGNVLQLPQSSETQYMHDWRAERKLKKNPDVVIVSGSLQFPWHESLDESGQEVHIATGGKASLEAHQQWGAKGYTVSQFGESSHVDVVKLMEFLQEQGYKSVCLMAGPDLLQDLLQHGYVKHFFVTMTHQILGGQAFKTLVNGSPLGDEGRLTLESMYMDAQNSNSIGQWFVEFSITNQ